MSSTRALLAAVTAAVASALAGCSSPSAGADASVSAGDAGPGSLDAGTVAADASHPSADVGAPDTGPAGTGHVVYRLATGALFRLAAEAGAAPQDVSKALEPVSAGADSWLNVSRDGAWLLLGTERFGCGGWACLAVAPSSLASGEAVSSGGAVVHPDGFSAISPDGQRVVYPLGDGTRVDLWTVRREGGGWSAAARLTGSSTALYHEGPSFSADGSRVVFQCGPTPYGQEGTAVCEVGVDGGGLRVVYSPADFPGGTADDALHGPAYGVDGSIVFEADWAGEQIYRLSASGGTPALVNPEHHNDNSPCVLPGGDIVSLYLGRAGSTGAHELKRMRPDGSGEVMLLVDVDVADIGIGCGR